MITHILILHGKLQVAIHLKQAIERVSLYEVHPFTTLTSSVEFLREHPQDVIVIDFTSMSGVPENVIGAITQVQRDILIIVAPVPPSDVMAKLGIHEALETNYKPRDVISRIEKLLSGRERPTLSAQRKGKTGMLQHVFDEAPPPQPTVMREPDSLNNVLQAIGHADFGYLDEVYEDTPVDPVSDEGDFSAVLNTLSPQDAPAQPRTSFNDLLESLKRDRQPAPPARMTDFIIRGGIDSILDDLPPDEKSVTQPLPPNAPASFKRLASDEPPMPTFEQGGTISDLVSGVNDKSFRKVMALLRDEAVPEETEDTPVPKGMRFDMDLGGHSERIHLPRPPANDFNFDALPDNDGESSIAQVILQGTLNQARDGEFSIEALLDNLERSIPDLRPFILPLPSGANSAAVTGSLVRDDTPKSPGTLPEGVYSDQTTRASKGQKFETHPENMETEWFDAPARISPNTVPMQRPTLPPPPPPLSLPEAIQPPPPPTSMPEAVAKAVGFDDADFNTQFELMAAWEFSSPDGEQTAGALYSEMPIPSEPSPFMESLPSTGNTARWDAIPAVNPIAVDIDRAAYLALQLTELSLNTTAEAALLIRDGMIIGRAGRLAPDEITGLEPIILSSWDAGRRDTRVQFITQPDTGRDYLLYACRTEEDFLLTLIFKGTTSMSDIRRQGNQLIAALTQVPEVPVKPAAPSRVPTPAPTLTPSVREPFSYVWLLRDPDSTLEERVAYAISAGLRTQLSEQGWKINDLQVHDDYVYLVAEVPGDEPAFRVVRQLKQRSGEIAHALNRGVKADQLWADSYLIVTPGRPLDLEEIQQFIGFERM